MPQSLHPFPVFKDMNYIIVDLILYFNIHFQGRVCSSYLFDLNKVFHLVCYLFYQDQAFKTQEISLLIKTLFTTKLTYCGWGGGSLILKIQRF